MGTTWSARFDNPSMIPIETVRSTVEATLRRVVKQMSTWEADSDISRFNQAAAGTRHVLEPEFAAVLACAQHWAAASGGAIDPTIGPLVALWGFGAHADESIALPSRADIAAALARTGWQRVQLDRVTRATVQPGGISLDLSGIAKGFAVDQVVLGLLRLGLRDLLVEIGGELRAAGRRPGGEPWQVLVESVPGMTARVALADMAIATSGDRWHAHELNGKRWSHTIDPRSGHPTGDALASVTVLHPQCMDADALATMLTVLGPDEGFDFAQHHGLAALFVLSNGAGHGVRHSDHWPSQAPSA